MFLQIENLTGANFLFSKKTKIYRHRESQLPRQTDRSRYCRKPKIGEENKLKTVNQYINEEKHSKSKNAEI